MFQTRSNLRHACVIVDLLERRWRRARESHSGNISKKNLLFWSHQFDDSNETLCAIEFLREQDRLDRKQGKKRGKEKTRVMQRRGTTNPVGFPRGKARRRNSRHTVRGWRDIWRFWDTLHTCNQSVPVSNLANSGPRFFVCAFLTRSPARAIVEATYSC